MVKSTAATAVPPPHPLRNCSGKGSATAHEACPSPTHLDLRPSQAAVYEIQRKAGIASSPPEPSFGPKMTRERESRWCRKRLMVDRVWMSEL
ncbi:hypothetical protein NL676_029731 [Syzygium grande]|nr:hypothetical protein NL676_029731 [Syzygium grande]